MQPEAGKVARSLAEIDLPIGTAKIVEYHWDGLLDFVGPLPTRYRIDYALISRGKERCARFVHPSHQHEFDALGQIFIIPPGHRMQVFGHLRRGASVVCEIEPEAVHTWLSETLSWDGSQLRDCLNITNGRLRGPLTRLKAELLDPGLAAPALCDALARELAIELARHCRDIHAREELGGLSAWRLRVLDDRIDKSGPSPRLTELADLCALSVRQLTRAFRISRRCSLGEYIACRQMDRAKALLNGNTNIKEVAYATGYASASNFSIAFHRLNGMSPKHYRESIGAANRTHARHRQTRSIV
jgi:AraC family transcriptional regulator